MFNGCDYFCILKTSHRSFDQAAGTNINTEQTQEHSSNRHIPEPLFTDDNYSFPAVFLHWN
jgi:hypothetical protein